MEVYDLDLLIWLEGILTLEFIWKPLRIHLEYRVCPVPPPPTPKFFFLLLKYNIYKIKIKAKPSNSVSKAQVICF